MFPSTPAIETALNLLIGLTVAASIGFLSASFASSARGQSIIWKTVTWVFLCLMGLELSGTNQGICLVTQKVLNPDANTTGSQPTTKTDSLRGAGILGDDAFESKHPVPLSPGWHAGYLPGPADMEFVPAPKPSPGEYFLTTQRKTETDETPYKPLPDRPIKHGAALAELDRLELLVGIEDSDKEQHRSYIMLANWWPLVWLGGTLLCFCRGIVSAIFVCRLRCGMSAPAEELQQRFGPIRERLGIRQPIPLFTHPGLTAPIVTGTLRPAIIVPANFTTEFTPEQQDSVFAHELSHLATNDNFALKLSLFAAALHWWCPAVWFARHRLRSAMEFAADEASLCVPDGPSHLADCLVKVGRIISAKQGYAVLGMAGRGTRSSLARRVRRLLNMSERSLSTNRPRSLIRVAVVVLFLFSSVLPGVIARADQPISNGESGMQLLRQSWRRSLLAGIAGAMMAPGLATAQQAEVEVEVEYSDGEVRLVEREVRVERQNAERERDAQRDERREIERHIERELLNKEAFDRDLAERQREIARATEKLVEQLADADGRDERHQLRQRLERLRAMAVEVRVEAELHHARAAERIAESQSQRANVAERRVLEDMLRRERQQHQHVRERHLRAAIENLMAAGLHEDAERIEQQLHGENEHGRQWVPASKPRVRRILRNEFEHSEPQSERHIQRELDELHAQMREMRSMMHELMRRSERDVEGRHFPHEHDEEEYFEGHDDDDDHAHEHNEDHDEDHNEEHEHRHEEDR